MNSIDALKINFDPNQRFLLNILLGFLMFGVALDIKKSDFQLLFRNPKPVAVGLFAQLVLTPIVTVLLVWAFQPPISIGLGMILVAACPGGNISNFSTNLSKGNAALSVTTTSVSTLGAIITLPLLFSLGAKALPNLGDLKQSIYIDPLDMVSVVGKLILFPLLVGMFLNHRFPLFTDKIRKTVKTVSLLIFFAFVIGALVGNWKNFMEYVPQVFLIVLLFNALALALGYNFARLNRLSEADARAITFETGIHNTGLGLILILNFFNGLGGMALIAAWYGIWDMITAFALATWWSRKEINE